MPAGMSETYLPELIRKNRAVRLEDNLALLTPPTSIPNSLAVQAETPVSIQITTLLALKG